MLHGFIQGESIIEKDEDRQVVVPCTSGMLGGERMFERGNFQIRKKIVWEV